MITFYDIYKWPVYFATIILIILALIVLSVVRLCSWMLRIDSREFLSSYGWVLHVLNDGAKPRKYK